MSDPIDRQAAINLFPNDDLESDTKGGYIAPHLARQMICELPSGQPEITDEQAILHLQASGWMQNHDKQMYEMGAKEQPQRTGRWEMVSQHENPPTYIYICSECRHKSFGFYNYCPHCGADMRGEQNG